MELEYEYLKNELLRNLEANKVWILASSDGERVSARSMSVVHNGLEVYFQTSRSFAKYRQMSRNGNVALCCSNVSIEGIAHEIGAWDTVPAMRDLYIRHHRGSYEAYGALPDQVVMKVVPHYAVIWKYIDGKPARDFLYIAEARAERAFYLE